MKTWFFCVGVCLVVADRLRAFAADGVYLTIPEISNTDANYTDAYSYTQNTYVTTVDQTKHYYLRAGAYWRLGGSGPPYSGFHPSGRYAGYVSQPPALSSHLPKNKSVRSAVSPIAGIESYWTIKTEHHSHDSILEPHLNFSDVHRHTEDKAAYFAGDDGGCLHVEKLANIEDRCLKTPRHCFLHEEGTNVSGISFSFWVKLPNTFDSEPRYIIDTGGDDKGSPGIAVTFTGANKENGDLELEFKKYVHRITVLISDGEYYWEVALDNALNPYVWNNVGVRFSDQENIAAGIPFGLEVFVNKTRRAWKHFGEKTGVLVDDDHNYDDSFTVGCRRDGEHVLKGSLDELSFWYWRVADTEFFDGDIDHWTPPPYGNETDPVLRPNDPWQYVEFVNRSLTQRGHAYADDMRPNDPNDCAVGSGCECVDTRAELQEKLNDHECIKTEEIIRALIRIANRAGPDGLSYSDIRFIFETAVVKAHQRLVNVTEISRQVALHLAHFVFVISKLTEDEIYGVMWDEYIRGKKDTGITAGVSLMDGFLDEVASRLSVETTSSSQVAVAANHAAVLLLKRRLMDIDGDVIYPRYDLYIENKATKISHKFYTFPTEATWNGVTDVLHVPRYYFTQGYIDAYENISIAVKLYNKLDHHMPAYLDHRVMGTENAKFFVNSRVISISVHPPLKNAVAARLHPVSFTMEHRHSAPDKPFKKGAILCVTWKYNVRSSEHADHIGAWDTEGCSLATTNDTHSTCACDHMGNFALLTEERAFKHNIADWAYYTVYGVYGLSIFCLLALVILISSSETLHYEIHMIHANLSFALCCALSCYLLAVLLAYKDRNWCLVTSAWMQYSYTATYCWFVVCAHYLFRAATTGNLGGRAMLCYCTFAWGAPAVIVGVLSAIDVGKYGNGERCLGATAGSFLWIYVGIFIGLCLVAVPLFLVAFCDVDRGAIHNADDHEDVFWSTVAMTLFWPFAVVVWVLAIFVYLVPAESQLVDFFFDIFNGIQGIVLFLLLVLLIPATRGVLFCDSKKRAKSDEERVAYRRKMYIDYYD